MFEKFAKSGKFFQLSDLTLPKINITKQSIVDICEQITQQFPKLIGLKTIEVIFDAHDIHWNKRSAVLRQILESLPRPQSCKRNDLIKNENRLQKVFLNGVEFFFSL